jgi:Tfp pilus assembly protein PilW
VRPGTTLVIAVLLGALLLAATVQFFVLFR